MIWLELIAWSAVLVCSPLIGRWIAEALYD